MPISEKETAILKTGFAISVAIGIIVGCYVMLSIWAREYANYIFIAFLAWPISLIIVAIVALVVMAACNAAFSVLFLIYQLAVIVSTIAKGVRKEKIGS